MTLQRIDVEGAADFDEAFATMGKARAEALVVVQSTIFETFPYRIQQLATINRIPAIYGLRTSADAGANDCFSSAQTGSKGSNSDADQLDPLVKK